MKYHNDLLHLRKEAGLTQAEVAERIGRSVQAYQNYEYGRRDVKGETLSKLAVALSTSTDAILGIENAPWKKKVEPATKTVPVVGRIAAGDAREAIEDATDRWYVPDPVIDEHPNAFYLVASGDSMDRLIPDGAFVLIDPDAEVHSGDVAAVLVNGFDATLKRVFFAGDTIVLHPESHNPEHHDRTIDKTDPDSPLFRVIGPMIAYASPDGWKA